MSEKCDHNCAECSEDCNERIALTLPHKLSNIHKIIAVVSGKGGVGKSFVTSMLAVYAARNGYRSAILDADIIGPSIPKSFGIVDKATGDDHGIYPANSHLGIKIMSSHLLLEEDTDPIVWRGPLIANMVKQFWTDVIYDEIDYMFIDMPPGTGDVPLTIFQSLPISGIVIVTTPQDLVTMIVSKTIKMANMMNIPILGLVENYSYFACPDCGKKAEVFGESKIESIASQFGLPILVKLPIDPKAAELCDKGLIEYYETDEFEQLFEKIATLVEGEDL